MTYFDYKPGDTVWTIHNNEVRECVVLETTVIGGKEGLKLYVQDTLFKTFKDKDGIWAPCILRKADKVFRNKMQLIQSL